MKRAFAILLMTTGLCAGLGAGSTVLAAGQGLPLRPDASQTSRNAPEAILTLIDDDGDEGEGGWLWSQSGGDDDDEVDENNCEEDDDDGGDDCAAGANGNASKAGTAPPPKNGLFTNGTAPVVKSN